MTFAGPSVKVRPEAAQTLGMALHELATNALKYGALSIPKGRVSIEWCTASELPDQEFNLTWSEAGGPEVKPITHRGFGYSVLMEQACVGAERQGRGPISKLGADLEIMGSFAGYRRRSFLPLNPGAARAHLHADALLQHFRIDQLFRLQSILIKRGLISWSNSRICIRFSVTYGYSGAFEFDIGTPTSMKKGPGHRPDPRILTCDE